MEDGKDASEVRQYLLSLKGRDKSLGKKQKIQSPSGISLNVPKYLLKRKKTTVAKGAPTTAPKAPPVSLPKSTSSVATVFAASGATAPDAHVHLEEETEIAQPVQATSVGPSSSQGFGFLDPSIAPGVEFLLQACVQLCSDDVDRDLVTAMSKFSSPSFEPIIELTSPAATLTIAEHMALDLVDRNRHLSLLCTMKALNLRNQYLKEGWKKMQEKIKARDKDNEELKRRNSELDSKVIEMGKELKQSNSDLLAAVERVSTKETELAKIQADFNEILPVKLSLEERVKQLEKDIVLQKKDMQKQLNTACQQVVVQFAEAHGLSPHVLAEGDDGEEEETEDEDLGGGNDGENEDEAREPPPSK